MESISLAYSTYMPDILPELAPYGPVLFFVAVVFSILEEIWHLRNSWFARHNPFLDPVEIKVEADVAT